jgi:cytochrome c oxidase subunit 3
MSNLIRHPFHLVDESPWPILAAFRGLGLTSGLIKWFHHSNFSLLLISILMLLLVCFQWWRDVSREGSFIGFHTTMVELGLRWGILLFIVSEIFFFLSFFWAFFHRRLAVNIELGNEWPPLGILAFNPFGVPLLNTVILLSSGIRVTWAHHSLIAGNHSQTKLSLALTVSLGGYFTLLQGIEYFEARFSFADSIYGSTFYLATGFHGLHVLVGTLFLIVCLLRLVYFNFSFTHHFGFEAAAWYWHFVDVVWLFLFIIIYWWGGA